jgi:hypothetical protein
VEASPVVVGIASPFSVGRVIQWPLNLPTPAAGGGFTYTVGGKYWERVASLAFLLTADGNAANRIATLSVQDQDSRTFARVACPFTQAATIASEYTFAPGVQQAGANNATTMVVPFPPLFLRPRWKLVVGITAVQVGDAITVPSLLVERFPTGPEGYGIGAYVVEAEPGEIAASV